SLSSASQRIVRVGVTGECFQKISSRSPFTKSGISAALPAIGEGVDCAANPRSNAAQSAPSACSGTTAHRLVLAYSSVAVYASHASQSGESLLTGVVVSLIVRSG